jgi:predicted nucleic acid-binding protein
MTTTYTDTHVFADTGAWFALVDQSDNHHMEAVAVYSQLLQSFSLLTTNLVLAETYTLVRRALGQKAAVLFLESIAASPRVAVVYSDARLESIAETILRKYHDQDFSYTDAVSFAVMRDRAINRVFAFDRHFLTAGFTLIP